jgi:hypothetical protein
VHNLLVGIPVHRDGAIVAGGRPLDSSSTRRIFACHPPPRGGASFGNRPQWDAIAALLVSVVSRQIKESKPEREQGTSKGLVCELTAVHGRAPETHSRFSTTEMPLG